MGNHTSHPLQTAPPPIAPPVDDPTDVKILVVDDQASSVAVLEAVVPPDTCSLVWARSADEALLNLLSQDFAAIVLDVRMPGMDGLELAEIIKQRRRTRDVPILFLTAHLPDERDVLRGYGTGAVDYLTKPVHPDVLRSKLGVFVDLYKKSRKLEQLNRSLHHEVTERERVEEALREVNQDLERRVIERTDALQKADQRKDEFLASLAHELRNPLAPIRSAVEVLRSNASDDDLARAEGALVRQLGQMTRLIDDLLDVSRITSDKLVLRPARTDLADVVAIAVETTRPVIAERQHQLQIVLPDGPVPLLADQVRLAQVLSNLLTNAAKYTAPQGTLTLKAAIDDEEIVVTLEDNGIGIEPELLPYIFEMFRQGNAARAAGGLGIGLTLARRIVEMHGGRLEAATAGPGQGSTFSVRLPLAKNSAVTSTQDSAEGRVPLNGRHRILVVDDNQDAAEMTAILLGTWGQQTRVAYDGLSALETGREFQPDIILLDIGLPAIDGYETARRIRQEPWGKHVVLVAVTGWGQTSDFERSKDAGFDHHLVKPVAPERLQTIIANSGRPAI
jgi:signal transduction histidine kinase